MSGGLSSEGQRSSSATLAGRLSEIGFIGLFHGSDQAALEAIWREPGAADVLAELVLASDASPLARFLAAELLFCGAELHRVAMHREALAAIYAAALAGNLTEVANPWGLPGVMEGALGERLLAIGAPMIPALLPLLDDETRLPYAGSQEATLGRHYGYRVKDLAAYYISEIAKLPLTLAPEPARRDHAIEVMRSSLERGAGRAR